MGRFGADGYESPSGVGVRVEALGSNEACFQ
jgi:hypothetical protein